jgi:hypothetical protein
MPTAWKVATALISFVIAGAVAIWMRSLNYSLIAWLGGGVGTYFALTLIPQVAFVLCGTENDEDSRADGEF